MRGIQVFHFALVPGLFDAVGICLGTESSVSDVWYPFLLFCSILEQCDGSFLRVKTDRCRNVASFEV